MAQKRLIGIILLSFVLLSGCETSKGFVTASASGIGSTVYSTAQGAGKDTLNLFRLIKAADEWMQRNLW